MAAPSAETLRRLASETGLAHGVRAFVRGRGLDVSGPVKARIAAMPMLARKAQTVRAHRANRVR